MLSNYLVMLDALMLPHAALAAGMILWRPCEMTEGAGSVAAAEH